MVRKPIGLSVISVLHYFKLIFRSVLFLTALVSYLIHRMSQTSPFGEMASHPILLAVIGIVFAIEMILRFFPSRLESMGCQKQFRQNFRPTEVQKVPSIHRGVWMVLLFWILLNGGIGALYLTGVIDVGVMILISLAYSVCDMICILFFCPFQTWMMKNKCCGSCRIYNWDYAMMFTPFFFVPHVFTYSLLALSLLLLLYWEIAAYRHPERFSEVTNESLSCRYCEEKLCHHKKQLRHFLKKNKDSLLLKGNAIVTSTKEKIKEIGKKTK